MKIANQNRAVIRQSRLVDERGENRICDECACPMRREQGANAQASKWAMDRTAQNDCVAWAEGKDGALVAGVLKVFANACVALFRLDWPELGSGRTGGRVRASRAIPQGHGGSYSVGAGQIEA